ncbi:rap1 GTPase-GDP dissociation stimulator 1 isoform X4 [Pipistrellus kuhlii]|uniref:rap1 GTPase-GDP dissociation stimulator 1 isoform X4 n=1 Tax=Pipistrellus kuhlii TaxID=59472 RepID=UPI001E2738E7|nr:rap1 GTPase-GDP dissociation stimulator 1 isoform X4 [Pipistrellus kuhlii]
MSTDNQGSPSGAPGRSENERPSASVSQGRRSHRLDSWGPPLGFPLPDPAAPLPPGNFVYYSPPSRNERGPVFRWWAGGVVRVGRAHGTRPGCRNAVHRLLRARRPPVRRPQWSLSTRKHTPTRPLRRAGYPGVAEGRYCACVGGRAGRRGRTACASGRMQFRPLRSLCFRPARSRARCRPRPPPCPAPSCPPSLVPAPAEPVAAAAAAAAAAASAVPAAPSRRSTSAGPSLAAGLTEVEAAAPAAPSRRPTNPGSAPAAGKTEVEVPVPAAPSRRPTNPDPSPAAGKTEVEVPVPAAPSRRPTNPDPSPAAGKTEVEVPVPAAPSRRPPISAGPSPAAGKTKIEVPVPAAPSRRPNNPGPSPAAGKTEIEVPVPAAPSQRPPISAGPSPAAGKTEVKAAVPSAPSRRPTTSGSSLAAGKTEVKAAVPSTSFRRPPISAGPSPAAGKTEVKAAVPTAPSRRPNNPGPAPAAGKTEVEVPVPAAPSRRPNNPGPAPAAGKTEVEVPVPAAPSRRPNNPGPSPAAGKTEVEGGPSAAPPAPETSASPSERPTLGSSMADNLSDALKKLKITAVDRTEDSLEGCLDYLLQALTQNNMETSEKIQESGILQLFETLLIPQSPCTAKVANIIAEVAKNEFMRTPCVDAGLISPLVQLLNSKDQEVLLQTGRALGNICYDSHEGRNAVDQAGGAQIVIDHLRSLCGRTDPANEKLLTVFCGMLMNYSNENDSLQAQLINMGVIPTLVSLLGIHYQNAALTEMCLVAFGNLAELESSKEQFASTNIAEEMVKLFQKQTEHDKREMIFEVLAPLAENDAIKLQLVEAGLVECLLQIVQQKVDSDKEDDIAELKTASDLMVLLLLGDESMQKLFEGGRGNVFQRVLSWIPSNNHQLQLAGALAIANFARNDGNCIHMVDNGIVEKLTDLLDRHVEDGNVTVQHAALSALRNLAIPVVNKAKMLEAGVTEAVLKFLKSEMPPVQFKLLGTLRMLIDAQAEAAEQLGKNIKLVERLVEWCEAKDHAGVMGESNRLLSALIRHSKSKDVIKTIVQSGGIKHLVTMATSEHVIMQNEALVALALIAALELDTAEKDLESTKLVQILHKLLIDERSAPEIKYNSMVLICALMGSESLHKEVQDLAFLDVVSKLRSHENKSVAQQASLTEQRLTVES